MDTDSFIVHVKTDDTYKDIAEDAKTKYQTYKNRKENKLFSIRIKSLYYKVFHRKCISYRNKKKLKH